MYVRTYVCMCVRVFFFNLELNV